MTKKNKIALLAASILMLMMLGVLYAWSMFRIQLAEAFPTLTAAQLSMNFTIVSIGFCLGGFFGGKLSQRWDQRVTARVSAVMLLVGFGGCSFMGSLEAETALWVLYVFYGAIGGVGVGVGYNACISATSPWFPEKLGLVSGVLLMGFGFGSLLMGLLVQWLGGVIGVFGVFRAVAAALFVVMLGGSFFLRKPAVGGANGSGGCTPAQMLARPSFWSYFIWNTISASAGLLVINSSANIALAFGTSAALGMIVSVFNAAGRPVTGAAMDKLGRFKGLLLMSGVLFVGGLLLVAAAKTGLAAAVFAGMILVGICYGGGVTISARVISDLYGPEHYAVNFSLSNFCMIPAAFIGPYLSGVLQDRANGAYDSTFFMVVVLALVAVGAAVVMNALVKREAQK